MRLARSIVVALLLTGAAAGCADSGPDTPARTPGRAPVATPSSGEAPTVTLTEPAGGPDRTQR